jgi:hypothetical protein
MIGVTKPYTADAKDQNESGQRDRYLKPDPFVLGQPVERHAQNLRGLHPELAMNFTQQMPVNFIGPPRQSLRMTLLRGFPFGLAARFHHAS